MFNKFKIFLILFYFFSFSLFGKQFYFNKIKFEGLYSISINKVLLGVMDYNIIHSDVIINHLLYLEAFDYIKLRSYRNTLIITVRERPLITCVRVFGDGLDRESFKYLNEYRIRKGELYDYGFMRLFEHDVEGYYLNCGFIYNKIKVDIDFDEIENTVFIRIYIKKNSLSKVKKIFIFGNTIVSEKRILSLFSFYQRNYLSLFMNNQILFREQVFDDLENLKNEYYNKGYMEFQINSFKLFLDKNNEDLVITVNLFEGGIFKFGDVSIEKGIKKQFKLNGLKVLEHCIIKNTMFNIDDVFIARDSLEFFIQCYKGKRSKISFRMYNINGLANIYFFIEIQKRAFINNIIFSGNLITLDENLRRHIQQIEYTKANYKGIIDTKETIMRYNFAKNIDISFLGSMNGFRSVDIYFKLSEKNTNKLLTAINYYPGDSYGINFSGEAPNVLGSGHDIGFNIYKSFKLLDLNFTYINSGCFDSIFDVTYNMYYRIEGYDDDISSFDHCSSTLGFSIDYSLIFYDLHKISLGIGYEEYNLAINRSDSPNEFLQFVGMHGTFFREYYLYFDYIFDDLEKVTVFPNDGMYSHFNVKFTLPKSSLRYFQLNEEVYYYYPLTENNILSLYFNIFYGDKFDDNTIYYPFFKNNFLKGLTNVRGFKDRTLGPRSATYDFIGGNITFSSKIALSFPTPIIDDPDSMRSSIFLDIGQVYTNDEVVISGLKNFKYVPYNEALKCSVGYSFTWNTPFGIPIDISFGYPLNANDFDMTKVFSFTFGGMY